MSRRLLGARRTVLSVGRQAVWYWLVSKSRGAEHMGSKVWETAGWAVVVVAAFGGTPRLGAQDRLKSMPGYDRYQRMQSQMQGVLGRGGRGGLAAAWTPDGKAVEFQTGGKHMRYDVASKQLVEVPASPTAQQ